MAVDEARKPGSEPVDDGIAGDEATRPQYPDDRAHAAKAVGAVRQREADDPGGNEQDRNLRRRAKFFAEDEDRNCGNEPGRDAACERVDMAQLTAPLGTLQKLHIGDAERRTREHVAETFGRRPFRSNLEDRVSDRVGHGGAEDHQENGGSHCTLSARKGRRNTAVDRQHRPRRLRKRAADETQRRVGNVLGQHLDGQQ